VKKENRANLDFHTVVEKIREHRPEKHRSKPIFPFRVLPNGINPVTGETKIMLNSNSTNPSDPSTLKDLGPSI